MKRASEVEPQNQAGRIRALFAGSLLSRTLLAVSLATVGLATFWGVHIYGKDMLKQRVERQYLSQAGVAADAPPAIRGPALQPYAASIKSWEMLGMLLVTTGGGAGLVSFGPICNWLGRRGAFVVYHLGALAVSLVLFQGMADADTPVIAAALPLFGFLTLGMHAGYAIYFPELFPTRLRGTGAGFCFNFARLLAAVVIVVNGWLQERGFTLNDAASLLALLFLAGVVIALASPETRGRELPE
jgi:hypothetical protein